MAEIKRFDKQLVVISGGLGDIGLAIALEFGHAGAIIGLGDILSEKSAEQKMQLLSKAGVQAKYTKVDVSNSDQVKDWLQDLEKSYGAISIVIVNAATITLKTYQELTDQDWVKEMNVNVNGAFFLANQVALHFRRNEVKGNVVFLGSWAAHAVHAALPAYSVSKAALRMLCQSMALEYAPFGIRINELAPGYVNAGLSKKVWRADISLSEKAREKVPVRALIEPTEVAKQLFWICDPSNIHLTGSTVLMDGGLSLLR
jgi:glucose 1-dehydrogenase